MPVFKPKKFQYKGYVPKTYLDSKQMKHVKELHSSNFDYLAWMEHVSEQGYTVKVSDKDDNGHFSVSLMAVSGTGQDGYILSRRHSDLKKGLCELIHIHEKMSPDGLWIFPEEAMW